eukprot:TRINITY_DN13462_c0_g1_i10.p1 TRINITY_DN13462_c0_g1~~TRINITY_DN13462_c0_g1_i10.p1  ORF type:complete len:128 (+),score=12.90 TRINITY_DN13462_c0_g1_i10:473-856(+)
MKHLKDRRLVIRMKFTHILQHLKLLLLHFLLNLQLFCKFIRLEFRFITGYFFPVIMEKSENSLHATPNSSFKASGGVPKNATGWMFCQKQCSLFSCVDTDLGWKNRVYGLTWFLIPCYPCNSTTISQ